MTTRIAPRRPVLAPPRRPIGWLVVQWAVVLSVALALLIGCSVWLWIRPHLQAKAFLELRGVQVFWDVNAENWMDGGTTAVTLYPQRFLNPFEPEDLAAFVHLRHLVEVNLTGWPALEEGSLEVLASLPDLETLTLDHAMVPGIVGMPRPTDRAMPLIGRLAGLKHLSIVGSEVGDAGLASIANLKQLRSLALSGTRVTDAGLAQLRGLDQLEILELSHTEVTDAGLEHLASLPSLRVLGLEGSKVNPRSAAAFQMRSAASARVDIVPPLDADEGDDR